VKYTPLYRAPIPTRFIIGMIIFLLSFNAYGDNLQRNSFGVGLGLHYGIIGISYDRFVTPTLAATFSAVSAITSDVYNVGVKYYLQRKTAIFKPRLSVLPGNNAWINYDCAAVALVCSTDFYNGVTFGAGTAMAFGNQRRHIIDFDIVGRLFTL